MNATIQLPHARGIWRKSNVCWLLATMQGLAALRFPHQIIRIVNRQRDIVSAIFQFLPNLRGQSQQAAVLPDAPYKLAARFIDMANRRFLSYRVRESDAWKIEQHQDARACWLWLLTSIFDLETETSFLGRTATSADRALLKTYMRNTFMVQTADEIMCPRTKATRQRAPETAYMLQMHLPKNRKQTVETQQLFTTWLQQEFIPLRECDHCPLDAHMHLPSCAFDGTGGFHEEKKCGCNLALKSRIFTHLPDVLFVYLKRFTDPRRKNEIRVMCYGLTLCDTVAEHQYGLAWAANHSGPLVKSGHWTITRLQADQHLELIDDHVHKPVAGYDPQQMTLLCYRKLN